MSRWIYDDGGRAEARFPPPLGEPQDCVTRAIAIATGLGYRQVRDMIDGTGAAAPIWDGYSLGHRSADLGVHPVIAARVLSELGWDYHQQSVVGCPTRFVLRDYRWAASSLT